MMPGFCLHTRSPLFKISFLFCFLRTGKKKVMHIPTLVEQVMALPGTRARQRQCYASMHNATLPLAAS
jgi:hypothetical protein